MKEMFGNKVAAWLGKRVTFYPTETSFGPKKCWTRSASLGRPTLEATMSKWPRASGGKNLKMTLRRVVVKNGNGYPPAKLHPRARIDPRITGAFDILGWAPARASRVPGHKQQPHAGGKCSPGSTARSTCAMLRRHEDGWTHRSNWLPRIRS